MNLVIKLCDICQKDLSHDEECWLAAGVDARESLSVPLSTQYDTPRIGLTLILDDNSGEKGTRGKECLVPCSMCNLCYLEICKTIRDLSKCRKDTWELASLNNNFTVPSLFPLTQEK